MLFTACILRNKPHNFGGIRLSVMSRHTLNDGITPDRRITERLYTFHAVDLAPSGKLMGDYYKRDIGWDRFEIRYREEIGTPEKCELIQSLATIALVTNVTLLCIEHTSEECHRRLLAEACLKYEPTLKIEHL